MAKVSFKVKKSDGQQYLIYELSDEAVLDEDVLDMAEDGELKSMVSMGFVEGEDNDSFCYDITDRPTLADYFEYTINKKSLLTIVKNIIFNLVELRECAIPLSYVVLHKGYIYIDVDTLELSFICIPIESTDNVVVDVAGFVRGIIAGLRYSDEENGDYVAKILSFVNDKEKFNIRGLLVLLETLIFEMDKNVSGTEDETYNTGEIIGDYEELESYDVGDETEVFIDRDALLREAREAIKEPEISFETTTESVEPIHLEAESSLPDIDNVTDFADSMDEPIHFAMPNNKVSEDIPTISPEDDFSDLESGDIPEPGLKMNASAIKINRAQVIQHAAVEEEEALEDDIETIVEVDEGEDEDVVSNSILSQAIPQALASVGAKTAPKPMPYLIRINTNERVMVNKQTFKIGKASIGMDYRVAGNSAISRNHATVYAKDSVYYIKDNKSTNHTYVNGSIVDEAEDQMLTHDAEIILGDEEFIFKLR